MNYSILKKPNLIIRDATERPETIESGSSIIIGSSKNNLRKRLKICEDLVNLEDDIIDYLTPNVSSKIIKILFSKYDFD